MLAPSPTPASLPEEEIHTQNLSCLPENHLEKQSGEIFLKTKAGQARQGASFPGQGAQQASHVPRRSETWALAQRPLQARPDHSSTSQHPQEPQKGPLVLCESLGPLSPNLGPPGNRKKLSQSSLTQPCRGVASSSLGCRISADPLLT